MSQRSLGIEALLLLATIGCNGQLDASMHPDAASPGSDASTTDSGTAPADCSAVVCDSHATCTLRGATPRCGCNAGYSGDGSTCTAIATTGGCDALGAVGEWQLITPPTYVDPSTCTYGVQHFAIDPLHPGTVYLGTCQGGIYKSTECGAVDSWVKINTGDANPNCGGSGMSCAAALDTGRQWSLEIDPVDSNTLYAANGFGGPAGLFKSTDGGVNWSLIWPVDPTDARWDDSFQDVPGFVGTVFLDPADHEHLLLSFHDSCRGSHVSLCVAESEDAGAHWRVADGDPRMQGYSPHDTAFYLLDSSTWIQSTQASGAGQVWRTADRGASWEQLTLNPDDIVLGGMLHRRDGTFLFGGNYQLFSSSPSGLDWTGTEARAVSSLAYVGDRIVWSTFRVCHNAQFPDGNADPYRMSSDEGATWDAFPHPEGLHQGGIVRYDETNHVLYSTNCQDGFWRVRVE